MKLAMAFIALVAATSAAPPSGGMTLGVTTHFAQGWPVRYWPLVAASATPVIRDGISWRLIEQAPGQYRFDAATSGHLDRACAQKLRVIVGLNPRNPLYDGGHFVATPQAQAAFAGFVVVLARRFGACLAAVEIGNEINARDAVDGDAAADRFAAYVRLLRAVRARVKPEFAGLALLGGSTNAIATGFLEKLFAAGALPLMDGVVVHPYRADPANVDWELARLTAAMRRHGGVRPIWATEFSLDSGDGRTSADYLAKMVALMGGAGVGHADWYALVDQPQFPRMGLFAADGGEKPAAHAFAWLNRVVLTQGGPVRIGDEPTLMLYRFGPERQLVWGADRGFAVEGRAIFRDATGQAIAKPERLGDRPVFIDGRAKLVPGPQVVLADSLYGFARAPWSYRGQAGGGPERELGPIDWQWTSYLGDQAVPQVKAMQNVLALSPGRAAPARLSIRYTARTPGPVIAAACLVPRPASGRDASYRLFLDGVGVGPLVPLSERRVVATPVTLMPGARLDFTVTAPAGAAATALGYRLLVTSDRRAAPVCA